MLLTVSFPSAYFGQIVLRIRLAEGDGIFESQEISLRVHALELLAVIHLQRIYA